MSVFHMLSYKFMKISQNLTWSCCAWKNKSSSLGCIKSLKVVQNHSNIFQCIGITHSTVGFAYEQNPSVMTSSNFRLKIAKKSKLSYKAKCKLKRCRMSSRFRKYIICQQIFHNRRARASNHEQKRIFRRAACVSNELVIPPLYKTEYIRIT